MSAEPGRFGRAAEALVLTGKRVQETLRGAWSRAPLVQRKLRTGWDRSSALYRRLRTDPNALHLGWLLAGLNVALVLIVVIAISASATGLLRRLADQQGLSRVQVAGAVAREEIRRMGGGHG